MKLLLGEAKKEKSLGIGQITKTLNLSFPLFFFKLVYFEESFISFFSLC